MTTHNLQSVSDDSAIRITPIGTHSGMDITIQNVNDYGNLYVGGDGVSTTNYGYKLMPGHAISFELPGRDAIYLIADIDDSKAAIIKTSLESQD